MIANALDLPRNYLVPACISIFCSPGPHCPLKLVYRYLPVDTHPYQQKLSGLIPALLKGRRDLGGLAQPLRLPNYVTGTGLRIPIQAVGRASGGMR